MKPKKVKNKINFQAGDVSALLCALPLVSYPEAETPEQTELNTVCCETAAKKLAAGAHAYSANELRVMAIAIEFALDILKGTGNEFISVYEIDSEWKTDLSKHFFTYNRLKPGFDALMDEFFQNN